MSEALRSLTKNERMGKSLVFLANRSFAHFFAKNERLAQKTDERILSPASLSPSYIILHFHQVISSFSFTRLYLPSLSLGYIILLFHLFISSFSFTKLYHPSLYQVISSFSFTRLEAWVEHRLRHW